MLLKLKKIFTTDLFKVSFLNGIATLIRMLTGFVSVKVVASAIGPSGIALLGQLTNFSNMLMTICSGGMNTGMTKHLAQYAGSEKRQRLFLSAGFRITAILSILCGLVLVIGAGYFSREILKSPDYEYVFYVFGATVILYAFNAFLVAILNGYREFRKYVTVNIIGSLTGLLFSIVLAVNFGIPGALIGAVTYQSVVFFVTLALVTSSKWFSWRLFSASLRKYAVGRLGRYALMALVSVVAINQSQLVVRGYIANSSLDNAGLWEGVNRISTIYLQIITTSLSVYYLPKLAGLTSRQEIRNEILSVYKLVVPFLLFTCLAIFLSRNIIISILFTEKFQAMEGLFAFQLAGDFFKMVTWVLGYVLLAKAMTKTFIIVEIASCTLFALLSIFFIDLYGTVGATIGYAAAFFVQFIIMLFVLRKILFSYERS